VEEALLIIAIIVQVGLASYILFRDPRSQVNRVFVWTMFAYTAATFAGLLRSVAATQHTAADLIVFSTLAAYVWTGTFMCISVLAAFYSEQFQKHRFWSLQLPLGLAAIVSVGVLFYYVSLPDRSAIASPLVGTDLFEIDLDVFRIQGWAWAYISIWTAISIGLLVNVAIRRSGVERRSAIVLGVLMLIPSALGIASKMFEGTAAISGPTLASAALSIAFTYTVIRFRLFSTQEVATELAFDNLHDGMLVLGNNQIVLNCNARAATLLGLSTPSIVNQRIDSVLARAALPSEVWRDMWAELQQGRGSTSETRYTLEKAERIVVNEVMPIRDTRNLVQGYVWLIRDVTELRLSQEQIQARNQELQTALDELRDTSQVQGRLLDTIRALSAPAVPIMQGIVVMPLSGQIDSERAQRILGNLLDGISSNDAKIAIIDITGVPVVDTAVAQHLIQAARAASLMGCRPLLVGIRPEIAQVIVELGIDMAGLATFSDLQSGVEYALRALGIELTYAAAIGGRRATG
jgi:PAS domain S-box-containing protein